MKKYQKPYVCNASKIGHSIVPAAVGAAALSVGGAFAVGVASGLMKDKGIEDRIKVLGLKKVEVC